MFPGLKCCAAGWILLGLLPLFSAAPQDRYYNWTVLIPQNDSRDPDVRSYDEFDSHSLVLGMNETEKLFNHHLVWNKARIGHLLSLSTPFCELRFDAVKPLVLTNAEKAILREYMMRGGFVLFQQDAYPYDQDEFWAVKEWPVIHFLTQELPASDPDFVVQKITDAHRLFHQVYDTETAEMTKHELRDNPFTPNRTFVTYQQHACAFVYGRYNFIENGKWIAATRPYERVFSLDPRGYKLTVNIYVYAALE